MYILIDDCHSELFFENFETEEEAVEAGERQWNHLSGYDKHRRDAFYVARGTLDDHDVLKQWK